MINLIWGFLIIVGIVFSFCTNKVAIINSTIVNSSVIALDLFLKLFPTFALWMGLTKIAEKSGLLKLLSHKITPILHKLFPDIPPDNVAFSYIASNIIANIFGLGSAATPFGLKAMESLQKINKKKQVASKSMITFLVINTSGLTLIPTTIISMRMLHKSANPTSIVLACILSTVCSTIGGIIIDKLVSRRYKD